MPTWLTKLFVAGAVLPAADLNQIRDNLNLLDQHRHTGADGDGSANLVSASSLGVSDRPIIWMRFPKSQTGFTYNSVGANSAAQNDEIVFPVGLRAGTYRLLLTCGLNTNHGIATFYLDAASLGTIDMYEGVISIRVLSISGIVVAASGWYDLKVKMETKNASSSAYIASLRAINLLRTGA